MAKRTKQKNLPKSDPLWTRLRIYAAEHGFPLTSNDRRIAALRNRYAGRAAFLIGNGPSVRIEDLEKLRGCVTFCCNRFHLAYDRMKFRPTFTISADQTMIDDFGEEMTTQSAGTFLLVTNEAIPFKGDYIHFRWDDRSREPFRFSERPHHHLWMGGGTLFPAVQIAYFMGIKHVYLYGVDHSFRMQVDESEEDPFRRAKGDENHFIENYRSGKGWSPPQTDHIERSFQTCDLFLRARGGWIKNATRTTRLEGIERVCFDDIDLEAPPESADPSAPILENGFFSDWVEERPRHWDVVGGSVRRTGRRYGDSEVVELLPPPESEKHPHLHQRLNPDASLFGGRIRVSADVLAAEKGKAFLRLEVAAGGERSVFNVDSRETGGWENLALELDVPPDADLDGFHLSVGLRKEARTPLLVASASAGARPALPSTASPSTSDATEKPA